MGASWEVESRNQSMMKRTQKESVKEKDNWETYVKLNPFLGYVAYQPVMVI